MAFVYFALLVLGYFIGGLEVVLWMLVPLIAILAFLFSKTMALLLKAFFSKLVYKLKWRKFKRISSKTSDNLEVKDKEFLLHFMREEPNALEQSNELIRSNNEIVTEAIYTNPWNIQYASDELRNNKKLALIALNQHHGTYQYLSDELKKDPDIRLKVMIASNGYAANDLVPIDVTDSEDSNSIFKFGKYKGFTAKEIAEFNEEYLHWILENVDDLDSELKEQVLEAIKSDS